MQYLLRSLTPREWLLSAFFVAVIGLKAAEGVFRLESWPLSDVRMFSHRVPSHVVLHEVTLSATRGGAWFGMAGAAFGLNDDELRRRLPHDLAALPAICGNLGREYNQRRIPSERVTRMQARVRRIPRPGVPSEPLDQRVECLLGGPPA